MSFKVGDLVKLRMCDNPVCMCNGLRRYLDNGDIGDKTIQFYNAVFIITGINAMIDLQWGEGKYTYRVFEQHLKPVTQLAAKWMRAIQ